MRCIAVLVILLGLQAAAQAAAQAQLELVPFPYATLVAEGAEEARPRSFVISAVEYSRRELVIDRTLELTAERRFATYEVPQDTDQSKLREHYQRQLGSNLLFQCQGRDCGRSNSWANKIFEQALLYGRDREQVYVAAQMGEELVAVYLVKRGNRRQYAHVEIWRPDVMPDLVTMEGGSGQWQDWLSQFSRRGYGVIPDVKPDASGELSNAALAILASLAEQIPEALERDLNLVCHLYPDNGSQANSTESVALALESANLCAQLAAEVFVAAGKTVTAHGVGPLAPNGDRAQSRLVLVAPSRLTH